MKAWLNQPVEVARWQQLLGGFAVAMTSLKGFGVLLEFLAQN